MCGRYFIDDEMWREIRKICKQIDDAKLKVTVGDVRPTDMAMVLTGMKNVHLEAMRWGFTSKYQDWLLINARACISEQRAELPVCNSCSWFL